MLSTERFRAFGPNPALFWHDGGLHRVVAGREVRIEAAAGGVAVEPLDGALEPGVLRLLGAPFDLGAFSAWAQADPVLSPLQAGLAGFRPTLTPDPFEMLVGAIVSQQVSLRSAFAISARLVERFGERHGRAYAFPTEQRLAAASEAELLALGFSRRKAEYVLGLARAELDYDDLARQPDDEVKERLTAIRGIGEWTADWFLARCLARPQAWPAGDLVVRKVVSAFYGEGRELTIPEVRAMGDRFAPFQNLTAHYLLLASRVVG
jgi:DNA-3-methyladenine glycosylase II